MDISQRLFTLLRSPCAEGLTSIPFLGKIAFCRQHILRRVALPSAAAICIVQGAKAVYRGEARHVVPAGSAFLMPARFETTIENIPDSQGRYLALCLLFDQQMVSRMVADGGQLCAGTKIPSLDSLSVPLTGGPGAAVDNLLTMAGLQPQNKRLLNLCLEQVMVLLGEECGASPWLWNASSSWAAQCSGLIATDPGLAWNVQDMAGRLGTSERSLRRHLHSEDSSFRSLLQEVRLNAGLALLQTRDMQVGEVAYRCGYRSASRFTSLFKARFGVVPSDIHQYRAVS